MDSYLRERQIPEILKAVVTRLCVEKPECPVRFMVDYLKQCYLPAETERYHTERFYGFKIPTPIHYGVHEDDKSGGSETLLSTDFAPAIPKRDRLAVKDGEIVAGLVGGIVDINALAQEPQEEESKRRRRGGFCDNTHMLDLDVKNFEPKSPEVVALLEKVVGRIGLFKHLDREERETVFRAMFECKYKAEDTIIREGDQGDNFYIVSEGECEVFVSTSPGQPVLRYKPGDSFGELALIHGTPRRATVVAVTACTLWGLERSAYRSALMRLTCEKREKYGEFLHRVPLLSSLDKYERMVIADCLETVEYNNGDIIIRQGDMGDTLFFVLSGHVRALQRVGNSEGEVAFLKPGDYFGEIALVTTMPRQATCVASGPVKCAMMRKEDFDRVMGPLHAKVMEKIPLYAKFMPEDSNSSGSTK